PIGLVIAAIVALIAAGYLLYENWETVKEFLLQLWQSISDFAINTWNAIVEFFTVTVPEKLEQFVAWFAALPGRIADFLGRLIFEYIPYALGFLVGFWIQAWI